MEYSAQFRSQGDVMKFKTVAIFIHGGHFNHEKSMNFRQFASLAGCVQSFMLTQKCIPRISEFWPKLTLLLEQLIKFVLISKNQRRYLMFSTRL